MHTCHVVHPAISHTYSMSNSYFLFLKSCFIDWVQGYNKARARTTHPAVVTYNMSECPSPELVCKYTATPRRKKYTLLSCFLFTLPRCLLPAPAKTSRGTSEGGKRYVQITSIYSTFTRPSVALRKCWRPWGLEPF